MIQANSAAMTNARSADAYVIPSTDISMPKWLKLTLLLVFAGPIFWGLAVGERLGNLVAFLMAGALFCIPVLILYAITGGLIGLKRQRRIWTDHSFSWYRATFPKHAHSTGHVSCRHCGSHKVRVTNLMKQTYMRVHACAQCGETLYFSPEKV